MKKLKTKAVYLSGPITDISHVWRDSWTEFLTQLGFKVLNPEKFPSGHDKTLVEQDLRAISKVDYILAVITALTAGTSMEIVYAKQAKKKVIIVPSHTGLIGPWHRYHATKCFDYAHQVMDYFKGESSHENSKPITI